MSASTAVKEPIDPSVALVRAIDPTLTKIYIGMNIPGEYNIAKLWVETFDPKASTGENNIVVQELPLMRLTPKHAVIPLIRHDDCSNLEDVRRDERTGQQYIHRPKPRDLLGEVAVGAPVYIRDHWNGTKDSWGGFGGDIRRAEVINAIAQSSSPRIAKCENGNPDLLLIKFI